MSSARLPAIAWRWLAPVCAAFFLVELAVSGRYGYHRDELYFVAIGGHPAFGYPDQPPLVPLLAHAVDAVSGHSLVWLRVPSAVAGALVILLTGLIAREFGAEAVEQTLAAGVTATAGFVLGVSHLMSTATFDFLGWTALVWLVVRALRVGGPAWLLVGLVAGGSLEVKTLPMFLLFGLVVGVLATDARAVFASRWLWAGGVLAAALWTPDLVWQASHGWPQLDLASSIAGGGSGSSTSRPLFIPLLLLVMGPPLVPIWLAGLWRLYRDPALARWRCLAVCYGVLLVVFLITGGKPYYLAGLYPALFAAGSAPTLRWARSAARRAVLVTVLVLTAVADAVVALPVVSPAVLHDTPIVAMNYDAGEQVGWPAFARTVTAAYRAAPSGEHAVVLTGNYGEAGAVLHYDPSTPVYSGHNAFWDYGPPPARTAAAIVVGYRAADLRRWFTSVRLVARIDNGLDLDNDEQGARVWLCSRPRAPWPQLWPKLRRLG